MPQTPRTPSIGMAHYFDDVFHRNAGPKGAEPPRIRRSSTARSIGARSDFDASYNGADEDDVRSISNSVADLDPEREKEQRTANEHMNRYISNELERVKADDDIARGYGDSSEFEATA
jgi:hypothetical protein